MVRVKLIMLMDNGTPEVKKNKEAAKVTKNKVLQQNKTIIVNWKVLMRLLAKTQKETNGSTSKSHQNSNKAMIFTSKRLETTDHQRLWFLLKVVDSEQVIQEDLIMRLRLQLEENQKVVDANRVAKRINRKIRRMKKQMKKRKNSSTITMKKQANRFEHQSYSTKKVNILLRMVQYTVVNGLVALGTAMESRRGLTGRSTRGNG